MTQAPTPETRTSASNKVGLPSLDALTKRPRLAKAALGFAALNFGAACLALYHTQTAAPVAQATPPVPVTLSRLTPPPMAADVEIGTVRSHLLRAQTWTRPAQLPPQRMHSTAPDIGRDAPSALPVIAAGSAPKLRSAPVPPLAYASLPRDPVSEPDPRVEQASLVPLERFERPAALRPRARPFAPIEEQADAPTPDDLSPLILSASLRPVVRPDTLEIPEPPTPTIEDSPAAVPETVLASLPREIRRPVAGDTCNKRLTRSIPKRRGNAKSGSTVMAGLMGAGGTNRDAAIVREVLDGNIPGFLHDLVPVEVSGRARDGDPIDIVFCVMPDYLAVGSDRDYVRVPMGLPAANRIAAQFDMVLPTRQMVDQIYRAADKRVAPSPMTPGPQMSSTDYLVRHNTTVERQLGGASRGGALVSGHKKDLVLTNRLNGNSGRVAIYGWHRTNGKAIQPLSTVHGKNYADYSHGVRLISQTAYLNGRPVRIAELFADPLYAGLLSHEGPLRAAQLRVASAN